MKNCRSVVIMAMALFPALVAHSAVACVATGPVKTAQWIYTNEQGFAFQSEDEDLVARKRFLSPRLYGLLAANWKCENEEQGLCALSSDPWINAQDGEVLPPITFNLQTETAAAATVRMRYRFGSAPSEPAQTQLKLIKNAKSGCWLLDDLVGRANESLIKQLQVQ